MSNPLNFISVFFKIFRISLYVTATIALFSALIILVFSPAATRWVAQDILAEYGLELDSQSSVRLNLFTSNLNVRNVKLKVNKQVTFSLEELTLKYQLYRLLFKELVVSEVTLKGLSTGLKRSGDSLYVAGVDIFSEQFTSPDASESEPVSEDGQTTELPFDIYIKKIELIDLGIAIDNESQSHKLVLDKIQLDSIQFIKAELSSLLNARLYFDGSEINIQSELDWSASSTDLKLDFALRDLELDRYQYFLSPELEGLSGELGFSTSFILTQTNSNGLMIKNFESQLNLTRAHLRYQTLLADIESFSVTIKPATIALENDADISVEAQVESLLANLDVQVLDEFGKPQSRLINLESLSLAPTRLSLLGEEYGVSGESLVLNNLIVSEKYIVEETVEKSVEDEALTEAENDEKAGTTAVGEVNDFPALAILNSIQIKQFSLTPQVLNIAAIDLTALKANIIIDKAGALSTLLLPELEELKPLQEVEETPLEPIEQSDTEIQEVQSAFVIQLGMFSFSEPASIHVIDQSIQPEFKKNIVLERLQLESVDSAKPEQNSVFSLRFHDGEYLKGELDGKVRLFSPEVNADWVFNLKEFSLPEVSPYLRDSLGFEIKAGQLDMDFSGGIVNAKIDSKAKLHLRGSQFSSVSKQDEMNVIGQAAVPLNVALDMLKDGQGNIRLDIPIDGRVDDPKFGMHYIIGLVVKKALLKQAKTHLVNTFVPYAQVVKIAVSAGSFALKVRFEDLLYALQETELSAEHKTFTEQFITLMKDKPEMQVKLCPVAVYAELGEAVVGEALTQAQRQELLTLAKLRADTLKQYLVKQSLESSRLMLCVPKIDSKPDAKPRIELAI